MHRFTSLLPRFRLNNHPTWPGGLTANNIDGCGDSPSPGQVVFFQHRGVIQAHAVVDATTTTHGVFLEQPQPRRGLACVGQSNPCAVQLGHQLARRSRNPREAHCQIESGSLSSHQCGGWALKLQQALPSLHRLPVRHQQLNLAGWIKAEEQLLDQWASAKAARLFRHPVRRPVLPLQGNGC